MTKTNKTRKLDMQPSKDQLLNKQLHHSLQCPLLQ
ncbi:hypothetical protein E2C01_045851 [Portunus trituberculatus]|uniref:Uncharacterized protein n=1 Tax=Portunus trituberculatus TaxID=210409 RepID=A0A5B7G435_PORTR|nr:hypothetical protein [Portunus trituberculatus]